MTLYKYRVWCEADSKWEYVWLEEGASEPSVCPVNTGHAITTNKTSVVETNKDDEVAIKGVSVEEGRLMQANNAVALGYTLYITGESDNLTTGAFGGGDPLKFNSSNATRYLQLKSHFFGLGAKAIASSTCSLDHYFDGTMIAPATTHEVLETGDYNKVEVVPSSGLYIFVPAAPGTGAYSLDLTAKITNTDILKTTMVPSTGNAGFFDYDSETNVITPNLTQTGGYNAYSFDVNLHAFGRKLWVSPGEEMGLDVSNLVGKKLFNMWKIKIEFKKDGGSLVAGEEARVKFICATKQNI